MTSPSVSRRISTTLLAVVVLLCSGVVAIGAGRIKTAGAETASPTFSALASADTTPANSDKALGQTITNLVDGSTITVNLTTTNTITAVSARLCKGETGGVEVTYANTSDFNPTSGGKCVLHPLGSMTTDTVDVETAPPFKAATIAFKVGIGSDTFTRQNSQSTTISCGPAFTDDCKLVLKVSTTGGTEFVSYRLNYASQVEPPGAPTAVKVAASTPASGGANVSWTAPSSTGGLTATISSYTATAFVSGTSAGITCVSVTTSCTMTGLTNSTPYTFKVKAKNSADYESGDSAESAVFLPGGTRFTAVNPTVALNTSSTTPASPITANGTKTITLGTGQGVATGATAVVLNVTVSGATAAGKITVYPGGVSKPSAEHLNFAASAVVSNQVVVPLGTGLNAGKIVLHNSATSAAQLMVHVVGYYKPDTGSYFTATSKRALQTSTAPATPLAAAATRNVQIAGTTTPALGIPAEATSVVLNVTVSSATASGYLTVFPKGGIKPGGVKSVNFTAGKSTSNLVTVALGTGSTNAGGISIFNSAGSTNVNIDVVGYYSSATTGARFFPLNPQRTANTSDGTGLPTAGKIATGTSKSFKVAGRSNVPASGVKSVAYNLTMSGQTAFSSMTVFAQGASRPSYANVSGYANVTVSTAGVANLGYTSPALGGLSVYNTGSAANAAVDLAGYFS